MRILAVLLVGLGVVLAGCSSTTTAPPPAQPVKPIEGTSAESFDLTIPVTGGPTCITTACLYVNSATNPVRVNLHRNTTALVGDLSLDLTGGPPGLELKWDFVAADAEGVYNLGHAEGVPPLTIHIETHDLYGNESFYTLVEGTGTFGALASVTNASTHITGTLTATYLEVPDEAESEA